MRASSFQLTTGFGFAPDLKKNTRYMTSELSKRKTEKHTIILLGNQVQNNTTKLQKKKKRKRKKQKFWVAI